MYLCYSSCNRLTSMTTETCITSINDECIHLSRFVTIQGFTNKYLIFKMYFYM